MAQLGPNATNRSATVAVVTGGYGDSWREEDLLARRLAGALACSVEVDVLVPRGHSLGAVQEGAVRVLSFPVTPIDPALRTAWRRAVFGDEGTDRFRVLSPSRQWADDAATLVQTSLLATEAGDAPQLVQHVAETPYELVVFVGHHHPVIHHAIERLGDGRRFALAPASFHEPTLAMPLHRPSFQRAERILVSTESEATTIIACVPGVERSQIENLGFLVGVNSLGRRTAPPEFDGMPYVMVVRDWAGTHDVEWLCRAARRLEREVHPDLRLRLIGPGAERFNIGIHRTRSRLDVWRWVSRALAVFDPTPGRPLGVGVLEALLYGTPVVVNADRGASQEHAEVGNGGLWYRNENEFLACIDALLDGNLRTTLGEQGRNYAMDHYAETDQYIKRVTDALLS